MPRSERRLTIVDLMLIVAGAAVGLWLAIGLTEGGPGDEQALCETLLG